MTPAALELRGVSLEIPEASGSRHLLQSISAAFPAYHLCAIVGPSGCGKSTLIKTIAGLLEPTEGTIRWHDRDLAREEDFYVGELAYVPQFSVAHDSLTVQESLRFALNLRVSGLGAKERRERLERILQEVGLTDFQNRAVRVLSGGQRRRLALALELMSRPTLMLCDEVTSGLDPKSEDEIVYLLHLLARESERVILHVTHSLRQLALYDAVLVLCAGQLCFHGSGAVMLDYFNVPAADDVFSRLAEQPPEIWAEHWAAQGADSAPVTEMEM